VSIEVDGLAKAYAGPPVFTDVAFDVGRGERLLVLGLNGAGKTTLLRLLAGVTEPTAGTITSGHGISIGYFAQEHEAITAGTQVIDHLRDGALKTEQELRNLLGMFGLPGEMAFQDAGTLSGGEKTKLALAQLVAGRHNLLLLDEPTNNLDPPSRLAIAHALRGWPGSMILVSHDIDFVTDLAPDRVLLMPDGTLDYMSEDLLELVSLA
jgi:ATPase subunit of ABC transporter with duplicated ATPase domains